MITEYIKGTQQETDVFLLDTLIPDLMATTLQNLPDIAVRNSIVTTITEEYFKAFSKFPSSYILQQLADYIMLDHIKDTDPVKMDKVPIMTNRQRTFRKKKESIMENGVMDYFSSKQQFNFAQQRRTKEITDV